LLAASNPSLALAKGAAIDISKLATVPLLLLASDFMVRRAFDAACRLAGITPNIRFASRAPHTVLALAEAGHGVAIIPSQLQADRYSLRIARITYHGKPLREPLAMLWDRRRPLPPYAVAYCEMLRAYAREIFPITRPSQPGSTTAKSRAPARRSRKSDAA
jgi:DNA-binding transcriptional LysR family regulator